MIFVHVHKHAWMNTRLRVHGHVVKECIRCGDRAYDSHSAPEPERPSRETAPPRTDFAIGA